MNSETILLPEFADVLSLDTKDVRISCFASQQTFLFFVGAILSKCWEYVEMLTATKPPLKTKGIRAKRAL